MKIPGTYQSVFDYCSIISYSKVSDSLQAEEALPEALWSPFINKGDLSVLFSETNVGKSILAMQIARDVAGGRHSIFDESIEPEKVLYFDFEMSHRQFKNRYEGAEFSDNFYRAVPNDRGLSFVGLDSAVHEITRAMTRGFKFIIIDNITFLTSSVADAKTMLDLMKDLKSKAKTNGCTLLIIAHTPKRSPKHPLTSNDISGSSNILNFADSAFALGRSYLDSSLRYIKQIKVRDSSAVFSAENVLVGKFDKINNFLMFNAVMEQSETLHLQK